MQYAVETFSLTKVFSDWWGRSKVRAVDDLNLQVKENEVFGLLGPNGSGKTTTIKMLLGLLHPTKGKSLLLGGDSTDPKISSRIGFLPEESYLYKYLNARETLKFYGRLFKLPPKVLNLRTEELLDMVGLKAVANRPVGMFSKGMARRIGLAQALINDPELLILDEPTTGLDPIGTRQIKDLIVQLAKRGKTIILCSHLLADVEDVCDRISILYGGKIQAQGHVSDLLQQTGKKQITFEDLDPQTLSEIQHLIEKNTQNFEITSPMDKLENFFIRTVEEAQKKNHPTSGAQSTTNIGQFLSAEQTHKKQEDILDRLVEKTVQPQQTQTAETTQTKPSHPQPDTDMLNDLTKTEQTAAPTPVTKKAPEPEKPQPDQDILNQLLNKKQDAPKGDSANE